MFVYVYITIQMVAQCQVLGLGLVGHGLGLGLVGHGLGLGLVVHGLGLGLMGHGLDSISAYQSTEVVTSWKRDVTCQT